MPGSKTERIARLEVKVEELEKDVESTQGQLRENHKEVKEEFRTLKTGQHKLERTVGEVNGKIVGHLDTSRKRREDRWSWLKYLIFPLLLALFVKIFDLVFKAL